MTRIAVATRLRAGLAWPAVALAGAVAVVAYVGAVDPAEPGHYPTCPFLALTGYYCPGCGTLRMVHAAVHGHLGEAFGRNPLTFAFVPLLGYLWARWAVCSLRGRPMGSVLFRPVAAWALVAVVLAFWLLRNLPIGHALAP